ncbi:hypothetical protein SETIT_1G018900v2 [Setaria italica]|uniref:Uncharacterized protein n=1 Tax=Setaria italica TaxID=4555 RepID=A0A368PFV7_SETIT|nr:hypothetical protein SETIT_1G018900v2 [Setaria italica]
MAIVGGQGALHTDCRRRCWLPSAEGALSAYEQSAAVPPPLLSVLLGPSWPRIPGHHPAAALARLSAAQPHHFFFLPSGGRGQCPVAAPTCDARFLRAREGPGRKVTDVAGHRSCPTAPGCFDKTREHRESTGSRVQTHSAKPQ